MPAGLPGAPSWVSASCCASIGRSPEMGPKPSRPPTGFFNLPRGLASQRSRTLQNIEQNSQSGAVKTAAAPQWLGHGGDTLRYEGWLACSHLAPPRGRAVAHAQLGRFALGDRLFLK